MALTLVAIYVCVGLVAGAALSAAGDRTAISSSPRPRQQLAAIAVGAALWPLLVVGLAELLALHAAADCVALLPPNLPQ